MIERYQSTKMRNIWSEKAKFDAFLRVEIASLDAFAQLGVIPKVDVEAIKTKATFNLQTISEIEAVVKHDVIAFTEAVMQFLGDEKKWFHYGLTSTDVVDSANSIRLQQANQLIEQRLTHFIDVLKSQAIRFKDIPCIGRTHGMHAEITSFGLKWALWYDEMQRNLRRFQEARRDIEVVKLSGAVGNFAHTPMIVEERVAQSLGLDYARISTQVLSRDRHAAYLFSITQIALTIEKIATEIRHLSRSEVAEVSEHFSSKQKGSSAMPHKRNPIASENMCGCARLVKSHLNVALDNENLWHERDISHSSAERVILEDATSLIEYMLTRYATVLEELDVNIHQMQDNMLANGRIVFSSRVMHALIQKGVHRSIAYGWMQQAAFEAIQSHSDFKTVCEKTEVIQYLSKAELEACFDVTYYLKNVANLYERVGL